MSCCSKLLITLLIICVSVSHTFTSGVPPPSPQDIKWVFQEEELPSYSLKYLMEISEERIYKINSVLRISDVQLEDEGESC